MSKKGKMSKKPPCNLGSVSTIKFIDKDGKYNIKCKGWKEFKKYNIDLKKQNISVVIDSINKELKENRKKINKYIKELKSAFIKSQNRSHIQNKLIKLIDRGEILEYMKHSLGDIKPSNIRYTDRKPIF